MSSSYINIPAFGSVSWKDPVATVFDLPADGNLLGDARVVTSTETIYIWGGVAWVSASDHSAIISINNDHTPAQVITGDPTANISVATVLGTTTISQGAATAGNNGYLSTTTQTIAGAKTFNGDIISATDVTLSNAAYDSIDVGHTLGHIWSTGLETGGVLTINSGDHTKFDLSAGTGQILDYSTINAPTIKLVSWNTFTAQTTTGLASADATYILIDNTGAIVQLNTYPTADQRRTYIFIGELTHAGRVTNAFAITIPDFVQSGASQMYDFLDALGPFNISGNTLVANGANLSFNKSAGQMFFRGYNYPTDIENPHVVTNTSATPVTFAYGLRSGTFTSVGNTTLDVTHYDASGVLTVVPNPSATTTIQRVYLAPNNLIIIQYGQHTYSNLSAAVSAIGVDPFIQNPILTANTILIGYLVVQKNCTALNNAGTASILPAPRFTVGAGGGVNQVVSLQQAYDSSAQPQIVLTPAMGGVEIFDAATPIGATLFQVASNGASNFLSVNATTTTIASLTLTVSLSVANGGTGQTTYTDGQLLIGNSSGNTLTKATLTAGTGIAITNGNGSVSIAATGGSAGVLGQLIFGDGSDGPSTISAGTTTLTKDTYYTNLTINGTGRLDLGQWHLFVSGTLDISAAPAGAIFAAGNNGVNSSGGGGASQGAASGSGAFPNNNAGSAGSAGVTGTGATTTGAGNITGAVGNIGGQGGTGGNGTAGSSAAAGSAGTNQRSLVPRHYETFFWAVSLTPVVAGGGGTGGTSGSGDTTNIGGGGGGGGASGRICWIAANIISRGASTTASCFTCAGGNGGNGFTPTLGNTGGGGGGAGGGGGLMYIVYGSLTGSTATNAIDVSGGNGGNGGSLHGSGSTNGSGGQSGAPGFTVLLNATTGVVTTSGGGSANNGSGTTGGTNVSRFNL